MTNPTSLDAAIIGAGPYGLSIAAHLRARRARFRIFGRAMDNWMTRMPQGMFLKSEGCASNLSDPSGVHALKRYCAEIGSDYKPWAFPISLSLFTGYALWFQARLVPDLEERLILACTRRGELFHLELEGGERVAAQRVIVATGLTAAARLPAELAHLPATFVTHSSEHRDFDDFRGKDVVVLGGGQAALESAALLNESGAKVRIVARRKAIAWNTDGTERRSLLQRIRRPMTPLGGGLRTWIYVNEPGLFYALPAAIRADQVQNTFGPAGAWWLRRRVEGQIPITLACEVRRADVSGGRITLHVDQNGDTGSSISADHVIAATGYEITRKSFPFLAASLMEQIRWQRHGPSLSRNFEASIPGLHFVGFASAYHYGPIMRFVYGAEETAFRVAAHVASGHALGARLGAAYARARARNSVSAQRSS